MMGLSSNRLSPLSPALQELLASERDIPPQPEIVTARALARAHDSLCTREASIVAPRTGARPLWRLTFAVTACLLLAAGAAAAYQSLRHSLLDAYESPSKRASRGQQVALRPQETPALTEPAVAAPVPPKAAVSAPRVASQEELGFLLRARQADASGDPAKVLSLLAQHERSFPAGRLSEEREVLRVRALLALGRRNTARQVAANFRQQFPRSVFLSTIEEMLKASR